MLPDRQTTILETAREVGRVTVEALAVRFGVTPQTIRKDLNDLCQRRLMTRVHGGAVLASGVENVRYDARRLINAEAKAAIAERAAALIPSNASLFINIGTTTEAVARALLQHQGLLVVTNNINVATLMRPYPAIEVAIAGGLVRHGDGGVVGESAAAFIRQFKADFAVIGCSAIEADGALLDYDYREVQVARAILENARHVILVADSSKLLRSAPVRIGALHDVHSFVTDRCTVPELSDLCRVKRVALLESGPTPPVRFDEEIRNIGV